MSGHTPGPWVASVQRSREGSDLGWIVQHKNGRICWPSLAYSEPNAEADASDPAREANARLIAAAPDMYEALKEALQLFDLVTALDDQGSNALGQAEIAIRAALAKAEGRE
jgi:hypothetical protein